MTAPETPVTYLNACSHGLPDPAVAALWRGKGIVARPHLQNWLDCIKTRETPIADVEAGHRAVNLCHLINICRKLERKLSVQNGQRTSDPVVAIK